MVESAPSGATEATFRAEIASWRELRGGTVEVLPDVIAVWTRAAFLKKPLLKAEFETGSLDSFTVEGENQHRVKLLFQGGEEAFEFKDYALARHFVDALRSLLGPLDEVSRTQMRRNEEARLRIEAENRWKAALQSYSVTYWATVECYRILARGAYRIVSALRMQSWIEAQTEYSGLWQKAEDVQVHTGLLLLPALEEIGKACAEANGPLTVEKCAAFVAEMARTAMVDAPPNPDWKEAEMQEAMRPNWYHMRYFILFCCLHHEAVLALELGDWASLQKAIGGLASLRSTLSGVFGVPVSDYVDRLLDAASKSDVSGMVARSVALDEYLAEAAARDHRKEVMPDNGALSEPA